jgi:hypothetical protein
MNNLLSTSSLSEGEVAVLFWATIGGIIVFIGLTLEKFADWMNERYLAPPLKPHARLELVGWWCLMLGIFVEITVGGWAANDAWQTRQMAIKNNPLNQPVTSVSASIFLWYPSGAKIRYDVGNLGPLGTKAMMWVGQTVKTNLTSLTLNDFVGEPVILESHSISDDGRTNLIMCSAEFSSTHLGTSTLFKKMTVESTKDWNTALIAIPIDGQLGGGVVTMLINSTPLRLTVLPQETSWDNRLVASSKWPPPKK